MNKNKTTRREIKDTVQTYWLAHYVCDAHCSLCGNRGVIDTTGVTTAAGFSVGRKNFCICPNGQSLREQNPEMLP